MKGFVSKRHLIILTVCILLIGVMVPLATFAKSASHEPHHAISTTVVKTTDASGDPSQKTTIDASCSSAASISPTMHPGYVVHIHAVLSVISTASSPETVSGEQSEGEFLQIFDTAGIFKKTVDYIHGAADFSGINVKDGNVLKACILHGADGPDGDESATITVSIPIIHLADKVLDFTKVASGLASIVKILLNKVPDPFLLFIITPGEKCILEGGHGPDCQTLQARLTHPPVRFQV